MEWHLAEISAAVAPSAHAIVLMDRASWHTTAALTIPDNLSLIHLPPARAELNPAENVWQFLRQTYSRQPNLSRLRASCGLCMLSLASTARRAWTDRFYCPSRLGLCQLMFSVFGIKRG